MSGGQLRRAPLADVGSLREAEVAAVLAAASSFGRNEERQADLFEAELSRFARMAGAVVTATETGAVNVLAGALRLAPGDHVIVAPNAPIWLLSALFHAGLDVSCADFGPNEPTLSLESVRPLIGPRTKAVFACHVAGAGADFGTPREALAARQIPYVLEMTDGLCATWDGAPIQTRADVAIVSLRDNAGPLSTGEGGALFFRDRDLAVRAKSHARFADLKGQELGINQKLSDLQSALGRVRLGALGRDLDDIEPRVRLLGEQLTRRGLEVLGVPIGAALGAALLVRRTDAVRAVGIPLKPIVLTHRSPLWGKRAVDCPNAVAFATAWGWLPLSWDEGAP